MILISFWLVNLFDNGNNFIQAYRKNSATQLIIHKVEAGHDKCFMTAQTEVRLEKDFTLIDLNFTMNESVKKLMVHVEPQIEINGSYKTVILNSRQVFCKCLNDPSSSHGVYEVYKKLKGLGNFPRKCPITIGKLYYFKGLKLDRSVFPPWIPKIENFRVIISLYDGLDVKKGTCELYIYGEVKK